VGVHSPRKRHGNSKTPAANVNLLLSSGKKLATLKIAAKRGLGICMKTKKLLSPRARPCFFLSCGQSLMGCIQKKEGKHALNTTKTGNSIFFFRGKRNNTRRRPVRINKKNEITHGSGLFSKNGDMAERKKRNALSEYAF